VIGGPRRRRRMYYRGYRPFGLGVLGVVFRAAGWLVLAGAAGGLLAAAWPLAVAGLWAYAAAWTAGWPPRRLAVAAVWCLPMLVTFAVAWGLEGGGWLAGAEAPWLAWARAWQALAAGEWARAMTVIAPAAIPAGLLAGAGLWRARIAMIASGAAGWSPGAAVAFDERQWKRSVRSASWRVRAPGGVPLVSSRGGVLLGAVIRTVGHRAGRVLELPWRAVRSHLLVVGTTGSGKTTTLIRLIAGFWAAAGSRFARGRDAPPWVVVIDAKGGFDSRDSALKACEILADAGAGRIVVWPDEAAVSLWGLPPARLAAVLTDMVPSAAEGAAAFYADVLASVVGLAVHAPCGPPRSSAEFLARLDAGWLTAACAGDPAGAADARAAGPHAGEVRLRFRALFTRLGGGFDGAAAVTDFDVLYCIVEGTASAAEGAAQARALTELVTEAATSWTGPGRRAGLLVLDEFSAVSGRVPVHELTERCRSLGLAVIVAAQSWEGLAPDEAGRARLAASAAGGVIVMRCPDPDALCALAGTRKAIEVGRKLIRPGRYGDEGSGRVQNAWVADPDRVRNFRAGQAAWIYGNGCTYVQVAPWRRPPRALTPPAEMAEQIAAHAAEGQGVLLAVGAGDAAGPGGPPVPLPGGTS
jgi:hypothetical protein